MNLADNLRSKVSNKIYNRGVDYYQQERIINYDYSFLAEDIFQLKAQVKGTKKYEVELKLKMKEDNFAFGGGCSCPYDWGPICKHQIAVVYKFLAEDYAALESEDFQTVKFNKLVELSRELKQTKNINLQYSVKGLLTDSMVNFKLTLAAEKLPLAQLEKIISYIHRGVYSSGQGNLADKLTIEAKSNIDYLAQVETSKSQTAASVLFAKNKPNFNFLLNLIDEQEVYLLETDQLAQVGEVVYPKLVIEQDQEKINLEAKVEAETVYEGDNVYWLVNESIVHPFQPEVTTSLPPSISVSGAKKGKFIFEVLPELEAQLKTEVDQELLEYELIEQEPDVKLKFDYQDKAVICQVWIEMGDKVYANSEIIGFDLSNKHYQPSEENPKLWRAWNTDQIAKLLQFLEDYEFHVQPDRFNIKNQRDIQNFLLDGLTHLPEEWEIKTTAAFDNLGVKEIELEPEIDFDSEPGIDWFEFEVTYNIEGETYTREELKKLLNYNQRGTGYFQRGDQYFVIQSTQQEEQVEKLLEQAEDQGDSGYKSKHYNLLYYQRLIEKAGIEFSGDCVYNELKQDITEDNLVQAVEVPFVVEEVLRDYQREGYYWLRFLHKYNFGGVLADDMGLGKTLQTLTLLKSISLDQPAFVICPRSLIHNWGLEIDKFFSELDYLVYHGTPEERRQMQKNFTDYQILITSYSIISRDQADLQEFEFAYCILDEAHHIKNRSTQKAQGVKQLSAQHKLALTGTPLENSLQELWSIFDFLMPGYLNNYNQFRKQYLNPIKKEDNQQKLTELKNRIAPFILRRTKEEVLADLPEKLVNVHQVEMTSAQEESYKLVLEQVTSELEETVQEQGFQQSQINILAALTKLRQICDHPQLVVDDPERKLDSAKLATLLEIVNDAIEAGHKLVVFSQFVKMLKLIKRRFNQQGIEFCYLDGSTRNRMEIVKEFNQTPAKKVFLISLKAGGVGLNLTGADMVIHVDPWWNPMVEKQASDRVHRIGQENKVVIYKLITAGTVEEKMLELKQRKQDMFAQVIENNESPLQSISWQDIKDLLTYE